MYRRWYRGASTTTPNPSLRTRETLQTLMIAVVLSRLDYGNAVLIGLPAYLICHLQSVMNTSARMIHRLRSSDHITDALVNLHRLCIPECIQFKVAVLVYKVLRGVAPQYLGPLTHVSNLPGRCALCSAGTHQPYVPFV